MALWKIAGVYAIRNKITGKIYVGSAVKIGVRWSAHKMHLRKNKHHCVVLQSSWNKHGEGAFEIKILEIVGDIESLREREQFWMDLTKSYVREFGYNMSPTAGSLTGFAMPDSAKEKIRKSLIGVPKTDAHRRALRGKRQPLSAEARQAQSRGHNAEADSASQKLRWSRVPVEERIAKSKFLSEAKRQKSLALQPQLPLAP